MTTSTRALAILRDADEVMRGTTCDASTDCCRFSITGREPQVTQAEWQLVVAEVARQGRKLPLRSGPAPDDEDDGRCPFLSVARPAKDGKRAVVGGRCTVYDARPLGCRTFFCERARDAHGVPGAPSSSSPALRDAARALEDLRTGGDETRARPLRSWLRDAEPHKRARAPRR